MGGTVATMGGGQFPSVAAIAFPSARAAGRRIAGVAAAARIVRELSEAGFTGVWLRVADGEAIDPAALADVARLAGAMTVGIGDPPAQERVAALPGDCLIPSAAIAAFLTGERISA